MPIIERARTAKGLGAGGGSSDPINTLTSDFVSINVSWYSGGANSPTISDSEGNTWVPRDVETSPNTNESNQWFDCVLVGKSATHTFSATGTTIYPTINVFALSGVNTASPLGGQGAGNGINSGSGNTLQPGSVTPTEDDCAVLTGLNFGTKSGASINGGFSAQSVNWVDGQNIAGAAAILIQTTAAAANPTWSWSATDDAAASIIWYKPDTSLVSGTLSVTGTTATSVSLAVTAATGGVGTKSYQLQRADDSGGSPGSYSDVGSPQGTLTWNDTGLTTGNVYWYRVVVTDDTDNDTSNEVSATAETTPEGDCEWILDASTAIGSDPFDGTVDVDKLYDDDFETVFACLDSTNAWAGIDLGSGVAAEPTFVFFAPREDFEERAVSLEVEWADTAGGSWTDIDTTPARLPFRDVLNRYALSPGVAKRCWRLRSALRLDLSELRWQGEYAAGIAWRPSRPIITPGAGRYAAGQSITIASSTTNAPIYYTTDGTTPDNTDTLYSGPISLPSITTEETLTIKAVAYLAAGDEPYSAVTSAIFSPAEFVPDGGIPPWETTQHAPQDWYDDEGHLIETHGGDILYDPESETYYWYGAFGSDTDANGIWCYSNSALTLYNWHFEGRVAEPFAGTANGGPFFSQTRYHPLYNASPIDPDRKYVILCHGLSADNDVMLRCSSASPTGPFAWIGDGLNAETAGPTVHRLIDASVFIDPADDKRYYVADTGGAPETHDHLSITAWELDPATDYTSLTNEFVTLDSAGDIEAPVVFTYGGYYWLITSVLMPYQSSNSQVTIRSALTLAGLESATPVSIWVSAPGVDDAHYSAQPTFALKPQGRDGVILGFDRWIPGEATVDLHHARHAWYPASPSDFVDDVLEVRTPAAWTLSELPSTEVASGSFGVFESPIIMGAY